MALKVKPEQERYVASNVVSIAESQFYPEAWCRAIYADETPVGFLMLHDENLKDEPEEKHFYALWRIMIDGRYQGNGYAKATLQLIVDHVRANPEATRLLLTYIPGDHSAEEFYRTFGFEHTGELVHDEPEMVLALRWFSWRMLTPASSHTAASSGSTRNPSTSRNP